MSVDLLILCVLAALGVSMLALCVYEHIWRSSMRGALVCVLGVRNKDEAVIDQLRSARANSLCGRIVVLDLCGGVIGASKLVEDGLCLEVCTPDKLGEALEHIIVDSAG
ncbi:MAG: hypothetical protein RR998_01035 [Oscillospiraceae bacterium]